METRVRLRRAEAFIGDYLQALASGGNGHDVPFQKFSLPVGQHHQCEVTGRHRIT